MKESFNAWKTLLHVGWLAVRSASAGLERRNRPYEDRPTWIKAADCGAGAHGNYRGH